MTTLPFQQKILRKLLDNPKNLKCADCNSKSPTWASLDYGVFVCLNCSGAHRRLGPRNTRIKSTTLDTWNKQWAQLMILDNQLINLYWEYNLNNKKKPTNTSSQEQINRFVEQKYFKKKFTDPNGIPPIMELKQRRNKGEIITNSQQFSKKLIIQQQNYTVNQNQQNIWDQNLPQIKSIDTPATENPIIKKSQSDIMTFDQEIKKTHSIDNVNPHHKLVSSSQHHTYNSHSLLSKPIDNITFQQPYLNYYPNISNNHQNTLYHQYHQPQYNQTYNQYHLHQYYHNPPIQHYNRFFENSKQSFTYNNNESNNEQKFQDKPSYNYNAGFKIDIQVNATKKQIGNKMYKQFDQFR